MMKRTIPCLLRSFNPYRVFKFVATLPEEIHKIREGSSFNPYRVFKFVATSRILACPTTSSSSFNPYRVFKFVATLSPARIFSMTSDRFQSLSGFQVRCNQVGDFRDRHQDAFQSLSGFQVRCNATESALVWR